MGKRKEVIVYYGMPSWESLHTRQNYFARIYRDTGSVVYYVVKPESLFKGTQSHGFRRNLNGIHVLSPRGTFFPQSTIFGRLELKLLLLLQLLRIYREEKRIYRMYVRLPHTIFSFLIKHFTIVYDIVDDYTIYAKRKSQKSYVRYKHKILSERADKLIVTNEILLNIIPRGKKATIIPNGVDMKNFDFKIDKNSEGILFLGLLSNWLNWTLIQEIITEHGRKFMIVGPISDDLRSEYKEILTNANWFGSVPQNSLEQIIVSTRVCVMPYSWDDIKSGRTPLKLYEYMATGRDIICVPYPNYIKEDSLKGLVHFVNTNQEFLRMISFCLDGPIEDSKIVQRKTIASSMQWTTLFSKMTSFVND